MTHQCIVKDCPAYRRPCGCGWLDARQPCGNPHRRDEWERVKAEKEKEEAQDGNAG